ncbi:hypothetical protein L1887_59510 [Cichorium endivia]|nr:hypothetical protein L1887_59510 [Cichorium endivia]
MWVRRSLSRGLRAAQRLPAHGGHSTQRVLTKLLKQESSSSSRVEGWTVWRMLAVCLRRERALGVLRPPGATPRRDWYADGWSGNNVRGHATKDGGSQARRNLGCSSPAPADRRRLADQTWPGTSAGSSIIDADLCPTAPPRTFAPTAAIRRVIPDQGGGWGRRQLSEHLLKITDQSANPLCVSGRVPDGGLVSGHCDKVCQIASRVDWARLLFPTGSVSGHGKYQACSLWPQALQLKAVVEGCITHHSYYDLGDSSCSKMVRCLPAHFDLATVPEYGFPSFTKASVRPPRYVEQNLAAVQDTCLLWILFHAWTEAEDQQDHRPFDFGVQAFVDRDQTPQSLQAMLTASCRSTYAPPPQIVTENQVLIAAKIAHLAQNPGSLVWTCEQHYLNFCRRYQTFLTAKAECWSPKQRDAFRSQVVKELRHLPERLSKSGFLHEKLRVWPHAFSSDCRSEWLYIFGLETVRPDGRPVTDERNEEMAEFVGALDLVVDKSNGRVEFNLCKQVGAKRVLDDYRIETGPPTTDRTTASSPSGDKTKLFPSPERLPPASEVLSRLRWDPTHTCFDYEVGYLDRFEGLMWLPLEQWGKAVEEEDFIPAHRIRVLRRMNGNGSKDVVWDREKRFCDLGG